MQSSRTSCCLLENETKVRSHSCVPYEFLSTADYQLKKEVAKERKIELHEIDKLT